MVDTFVNAANNGEMVDTQIKNLKRSLRKVKKTYTFFKKVACLNVFSPMDSVCGATLIISFFP